MWIAFHIGKLLIFKEQFLEGIYEADLFSCISTSSRL